MQRYLEMDDFLLAFAVFTGVFFGLFVYRKLAERLGLLDIPNERSSHTEPVPRGGGLVIALILFISFWISAGNLEHSARFWHLWTFGLSISALGFYDDVRSLGILPRLVLQILISALFLFVFHLNGEPPTISTVFFPAAVIWFLVVINAFNFLDGIDGMIALSALAAAALWRFFSLESGFELTATAAGMVAASALAFFLHNRQPARIFLGDSGSTFFGFLFAALPLITIQESASGYRAEIGAAGVIFIWPVLADAVFTRLWRAIYVRRFWEPNRDHFYQRLVDSGRSHRFVSALYAAAAFIAGGIYVFAESADGRFPVFTVSFISANVFAALIWRRLWQINKLTFCGKR